MENKETKENIKIKNQFFINLYEKRSQQPENFYSLPKVKYINYLNTGLNTLFNESNENIYYFFDIDKSILTEEPQSSFHISQSFSQNKQNDVNLDLLIAYFVWYANENWFTKENGNFKLNVNKIKDQCGVDIDRNNVIINGQPLLTINGLELEPNTIGVDKVRYVDKFNLYIMKLLDSFNVKIDLNMIFKLNILICQNSFNFLLTRCFEPIINKKFGNVDKFLTGREKSVNINIAPDGQNVVLIFNSIIRQIDSRSEIIDVGKMSYELLLDFNLNSFELTNFTLDYDIVEESNGLAQGQPQRQTQSQQRQTQQRQTQSQQRQTQDQEQEPANTTTNKLNEWKESVSNVVGKNKPEMVALATTVGLAGLGSLLIAGVLGGNAKTKKNISGRKRKTHKNRKTYKRNIRKHTHKHRSKSNKISTNKLRTNKLRKYN